MTTEKFSTFSSELHVTVAKSYVVLNIAFSSEIVPDGCAVVC